MRSSARILSLLLLCSAFCCTACHHSHSKAEIENAMQEYNRLIKKMDADSISLLFTPDGDLGDQAHGRSWIKRFLSSFPNVKVLSQTSVTHSIDITGDSSLQKGTYSQVDLIAPLDTIRVKGEFTAHWVWYKQYGWLIRKMETKPIN